MSALSHGGKGPGVSGGTGVGVTAFSACSRSWSRGSCSPRGACRSSRSPTAVIAGVPMPAVQVQVLDTSGQPDATSADPVTIALATNPGGASLQGTVTENAVNGVATFSDLVITTGIPALGFALFATSGSGDLADVDAIPGRARPVSARVHGGARDQTDAGGASLGTITVQVDDQSGLPVSVPGSPQVALYLEYQSDGRDTAGDDDGHAGGRQGHVHGRSRSRRRATTAWAWLRRRPRRAS